MTSPHSPNTRNLYLSIDQDLELNRVNSNPLIECFDEIICGVHPTPTKASKIAKSILYPTVGFITATGNLFFISLSEKAAGDNTPLKYALIIGNVTSFGILTTYLAMQRLSELLSTQTPAQRELAKREIATKLRISGYAAAILLGSISQFPVSYMAYSNNEKYPFFAGFYVFISNVSYPISSLKGSIFHALKMRNLSEEDRYICSKRDQLVKLVKDRQAYLLGLPLDIKSTIVEAVTAHSHNSAITSEKRTALYLNEFLLRTATDATISLNQGNPCINFAIKAGRAITGLAGCFVAATFMSHYWEASRLATEEMYNNDGFNYSSAGFVTASNAYLSFRFIAGSFVGLYDTGISYLRGTPLKSLGTQIMPKLEWSLRAGALALAANTWGAPYQISRDYFNGPLGDVIAYGSSVGNAVVANAAMQASIDDAMNYAIAHYGPQENRVLAQFCLDLNRFILALEQASPATLAHAFSLWGKEEPMVLQHLGIEQNRVDGYSKKTSPKKNLLLQHHAEDIDTVN